MKGREARQPPAFRARPAEPSALSHSLSLLPLRLAECRGPEKDEATRQTAWGPAPVPGHSAGPDADPDADPATPGRDYSGLHDFKKRVRFCNSNVVYKTVTFK